MDSSNRRLEIYQGCPWTAADLRGYNTATFIAKLKADTEAAATSIITAGNDAKPAAMITSAMAVAAATMALLDSEKGLSSIMNQLMR